MHAAEVARSARLQRVLDVLRRGGAWSTLDLVREARVCAVNSCIAELRDPVNGFDVRCHRSGDVWYYRLVEQGQMRLSFEE